MPARSPWPYCRQVLRTAQYYNRRTAAPPVIASDANAAARPAIRMTLPVIVSTRAWLCCWVPRAHSSDAVVCARTAIAAPRRIVVGWHLGR